MSAIPGQEIHRFPNGYGASVIELHGARELAVLWFDGDQPIHTGIDGLVRDVVTVRDDAHLVELLDRIAALRP